MIRSPHAILPFSLCALLSALPSRVVGIKHRAAAPRIILFYGRPLKTPVVLTNWRENMAFLQSLVPKISTAPRSRGVVDSLRVALFWGAEWSLVAQDSGASSRLDPRQANQAGWLFFSATGRALELSLSRESGAMEPISWRRFVVSDRTRAILMNHNLPPSMH